MSERLNAARRDSGSCELFTDYVPFLVVLSSHLRLVVFFFSSRRRHTRFDCDWSSDVCSSDLPQTLSTNQYTVRGDQKISDKWTVFGTWAWSKLTQAQPQDLPTQTRFQINNFRDRKSVV